MNDERFQKSKQCNNSNNNNISSKLTKCNNTLKSEYYLAEAAKVSLKNVLNGANKETIVAAAKLLNATKAFHFSPPPPPSRPPQSTTTTPTLKQQHNKNLISTKAETFTQAVVVNNGLSSLSTKATTTTATTTSSSKSTAGSMAAIATTPTLHVGGGGGGTLDAGLKMATDCEVIDYTLNNLKSNNNNNNNNNNNTNNNNNSRNNFDDRQQYGGLYGGRLQFFKDGKFILELARSKDGERSGWVSVPRKTMRPPSATSSTITPTSATSLVAYPKNESSTSLSFSDDNSSIQSSPWQRDHCWKQASPKRNISQEMCMYFMRPQQLQRTEEALKVSCRKRRQPLNKLRMALSIKLFQRLDINDEEYVKKCSITADVEEKEQQEMVVTSKETTEKNTLNSDESKPKDFNSISLEQSADDNKNTKMEVIEEKKDVKEEDEVEKEEEENVCDRTDIEKSNTLTINTKTDNEHNKLKDVDELNSNGIMQNNTSKLNEHEQVVTTNENDNENDDDNNNNDDDTENESKIIVKRNNKEDVKRKRLKVFKERAKLDTIVQKLNQRVLRDTVQQLKFTPTTITANCSIDMSGNGLIKNSNNSMHKTTTTTTANRLVEFHHQHVSPRKRILRELEKVTLEDAGAKRSRAKLGNNNFTSTKLPITTVTTTVDEKTITTITSTDANTTPTTTRLYSSYSIHSLLSGSSSSSNNNKKPTISYDKQPNVDNYQRNLMLGSPKSPEHAKLYKKRSPPYMPENSHHHHHHLIEHHHHQQQGFQTPNYNNIPKNVQSTNSNTYTSQHQQSAFTSAVNLLSPQSSTALVDSTVPRTVPKKTPSIRRQFASPTTVAASPPTTATTLSSLNENDIYMTHGSLPQHWPAVSTAPTMHAPLHFYMYPPAPPPPPTANGSSANDAALAAAAYIPYYHPYFSTLAALRQNPLWLHHYAGHHAAAAAATATRLSPPTPNPPPPPTYAGNNSNYMQYMPTSNSRSPAMHCNNNNKLYNSNKLTSSTTTTSLVSNNKHRISTPTSSMSSASGSYKSGNIKDEPSSDVPLNLSKH